MYEGKRFSQCLYLFLSFGKSGKRDWILGMKKEIWVKFGTASFWFVIGHLFPKRILASMKHKHG